MSGRRRFRRSSAWATSRATLRACSPVCERFGNSDVRCFWGNTTRQPACPRHPLISTIRQQPVSYSPPPGSPNPTGHGSPPCTGIWKSRGSFYPCLAGEFVRVAIHHLPGRRPHPANRTLVSRNSFTHRPETSGIRPHPLQPTSRSAPWGCPGPGEEPHLRHAGE